MKPVGYLTLFCETGASTSGAMEKVAIPSEFSRCLFETFDEMLLFLCFIHDNNCSQVYVLPKSGDLNKVCL